MYVGQGQARAAYGSRVHDRRGRATQQVRDPLGHAVPPQAMCGRVADPRRSWEGRPVHDDHCELYEAIARQL